jgi:Leucine-rich repeat (LRR) protein
MKALVELRLSGNPISKLDKRIKGLINLEYLCLFSTKIAELPSEIGELKSLIKLECSALKSDLPESFCNLTNLKNLDVRFDMVENPLPEDFGLLKNLEEFRIDSGNLNQLPDSFGKLDNLKRLSLRHTKFETFPLVLTELKNIGHLDLMYNSFAEVPEELAKMKSLHLIHFDNNPLASSAAMKKKCAALLPGVYFSY